MKDFVSVIQNVMSKGLLNKMTKKSSSPKEFSWSYPNILTLV